MALWQASVWSKIISKYYIPRMYEWAIDDSLAQSAGIMQCHWLRER